MFAFELDGPRALFMSFLHDFRRVRVVDIYLQFNSRERRVTQLTRQASPNE